MGLVLGLDGGGTKTVLALADRSGTVQAFALGDGIDPLGDPDWAASSRALFAQFAAGPDIEAGLLGLPCHGEIPSVTAAQDRLAQDLLGGRCGVVNDVGVAFDGAFGSGGGVLVLSGTGSMAWASAGGPEAPAVRVGGWGSFFGDEGSAFWIGREALALASRALDGRNASDRFAAALLARIGVAPTALLEWTQSLPNRRVGVAGLAREVSALARDGDPDASRLLTDAADHLAEHALAAWRAVDAGAPFVWSHAGGVFASGVVRHRLAERLACEPVAPRLPPIGGALIGAARRAGWDVGPAWIDRLAASLADRMPETRPLTPSHEDWP